MRSRRDQRRPRGGPRAGATEPRAADVHTEACIHAAHERRTRNRPRRTREEDSEPRSLSLSLSLSPPSPSGNIAHPLPGAHAHPEPRCECSQRVQPPRHARRGCYQAPAPGVRRGPQGADPGTSLEGRTSSRPAPRLSTPAAAPGREPFLRPRPRLPGCSE